MTNTTDLRKKIDKILSDGIKPAPGNKAYVDMGEVCKALLGLIQDHDKNVRNELLKALPWEKPAVPFEFESYSEVVAHNQAIKDVKAAINEVFDD